MMVHEGAGMGWLGAQEAQCRESTELDYERCCAGQGECKKVWERCYLGWGDYEDICEKCCRGQEECVRGTV